MVNPDSIYTLNSDLSIDDAKASVMLVALGGFVDAGHTQRLLAEHLLAHHDHELVATFDVDQLIDYRGRRPMLTFEVDRFTAYSAPKIELHRLRDLDGTSFLLLTGVEPDYQWERVIAAVSTLIEQLDVQLTVSLHGIPMAVPHTRPIGVTAHGTNDALIAGEQSPFAKVMVPGSLESLLELRLGEKGRDALGFSVHVPHYLSQVELPAASVVALDRVVGVTGLRLQRAELDQAAASSVEALRAELAEREEIAPVIAALEQQYDAYMGSRERPSLMAPETSLPSADEIAAEAEAFLRGLEG